jgi:murein L,D-transpeptidase YafK
MMKLRKFKKPILGIVILFFFAIAYNLYPEEPLRGGVTIDHLHVVKSRHIMEAYSNGQLVKTYKISIGRGEWGMHDRESNLTPTGTYTISKLPQSSFHKALPISYGDLIEIHGLHNHLGFIGKFQRWIDWTRGCIAVTNSEVDELYSAVKIGATIEIEA